MQVIDQEKVMLHSTSKQWHVVSLRCAATMPSFRLNGGDEEEAPGGRG